MKKSVNKKYRNHKTLLKRLSLGAIVLLIFASSSLQARAYYEKDPELEYLRTAKALVERMDEFYDQTDSVEYTVSDLSNFSNFDSKDFSRKILLASKSQASYYIQTTPVKYWLNNQGKLIMLKISLNIENAPQEREADLATAMIAEEIRSLTDDPREMVALVNQYLVDNVEYPRTVDYDDETLWNAYGALIQGKAVCEGYSLAFNKIMRFLDIPVINVLGTANREGHMWNQVLLDGQWLHVDVTFNDPVFRGRKPSASAMRQYNEKYLLLTDKELQRLGSHAENSDVAKEEIHDLFCRNNVDHLARQLQEQGLFLGDERGFRLDDSLTRAEMAVMLVRLSGGIDEAEGNPEYYHNICKVAFSDVPDWVAPYVGYCYENKLLAGIGKGLYGSGKPASKLDYSAVLLRAAGIYEGYTYQTSDVEAVKQGLLSKTRAAFSDLSRADVVSMTYNFLSM